MKECDHSVCATCVSLTECIVACEKGCILCDSSRSCSSVSPGFLLEAGKPIGKYKKIY